MAREPPLVGSAAALREARGALCISSCCRRSRSSSAASISSSPRAPKPAGPQAAPRSSACGRSSSRDAAFGFSPSRFTRCNGRSVGLEEGMGLFAGDGRASDTLRSSSGAVRDARASAFGAQCNVAGSRRSRACTGEPKGEAAGSRQCWDESTVPGWAARSSLGRTAGWAT